MDLGMKWRNSDRPGLREKDHDAHGLHELQREAPSLLMVWQKLGPALKAAGAWGLPSQMPQRQGMLALRELARYGDIQAMAPKMEGWAENIGIPSYDGQALSLIQL